MMSGTFLLAAAWTIRSSTAFALTAIRTSTTTSKSFVVQPRRSSLSITRLLSSASESSSSFRSVLALCNISRLTTLQTLLSKHGAPGSVGCRQGNDDLIPVLSTWNQETPELISTMEGNSKASIADIERFENLHPYLYPIAQSQSSGHIVCAYMNPATEEYDPNHPWPIVESKVGAPGFQLLALNSEHLMRRIACECDVEDENNNNDLKFSIQLYNDGLGRGLLKDSKLDTPYDVGSVAKLGYGVDKYVLLRVGPFPDLYEMMARQHFSKGDEQSSLIAAEASNGKFSGFASTFRFYARLLSSYKNREEEARDAARMCLRLPLSSIGMSYHDLEEVAFLGRLVTDESATSDEALGKMKDMFQLMKSVETEEDANSSGKTPTQMALDEATAILDDAVLNKKEWKDVRPDLARQLRVAGKDDFANFVSYYTR